MYQICSDDQNIWSEEDNSEKEFPSQSNEPEAKRVQTDVDFKKQECGSGFSLGGAAL